MLAMGMENVEALSCLTHSLRLVIGRRILPTLQCIACCGVMWKTLDLEPCFDSLTCSGKVTATYLAMYCLLWKTLDPCLPSLTPGERYM